ncbi:MAG: metabolite traffic protein EboE [Planctomycetota bacterium]|jgi:sugar phosphate isomerase/epimerase
MDFVHADRPGRRVRLAYCLNVHPSDDVDGVLDGLERITAPLRERIAPGAPFGVGMYLPAAVAEPMAGPGRVGLDRLRGALGHHGLVPFTFNAFPHGGFLERGLKRGVFRPRWDESARVDFTRAVASLACELAGEDGGHVSISTHDGMHGTEGSGLHALERCAPNFGAVAQTLREHENRSGVRVVLGVEPEPRSSANDTAEWSDRAARQVELICDGDGGLTPDVVTRHLGLCLDACHAAVEFEPLDAAARRARDAGRPLAKFQFSSALRLPAPHADPTGRVALLALHEPTFLHQVTARGSDGRLHRVGDLDELEQRADEPEFASADEWRCHFHVPVDLEGPLEGSGSLSTTVSDADALLRRLLDDPDLWGLDDLHLEIETYTWSVLSSAARGAGDLIDGLEREYAHVLGVLDGAGWRRA